MLTKGIYSGFHRMSQYKDQITGDIATDIRCVDNMLVNFANNIKNYKVRNVNLADTEPKFSNKYFVLDNATNFYNYAIKVDPSTFNSFTFSFWLYIHTNPRSASVPYCFSGIVIANSAIHIEAHIQVSGTNTGMTVYTMPDWYRAAQQRISNTVPLKSWHHYAIVYNGSVLKLYQDGILKVSLNYTLNQITNFSFLKQPISDANGNRMIDYFDDIVLIKNQVLWTENFTVPNNYLTGDKELPKKLSKKQIIYGPFDDYNDYFDKAFIY